MLKNGTVRFVLGIFIGYCMMQGAVYLHDHYLWTLFYR